MILLRIGYESHYRFNIIKIFIKMKKTNKVFTYAKFLIITFFTILSLFFLMVNYFKDLPII